MHIRIEIFLLFNFFQQALDQPFNTQIIYLKSKLSKSASNNQTLALIYLSTLKMTTPTITLQQAHIQNIREIEFQKDIQTFKQAQSIRSRTIKQQCQQINELYERKLHDLKIQKKIKQSSFVNEMRMRIAKTKYLLCQQIFSEVLKQLAIIASSNDKDYQFILISFIVEGCIQMFQEDIKIKALERDLPTIKNLLPDVLKSFQYFMEQEMGQQFPINLIVLQNDTLKQRQIFQKELNKNEESQLAIGGVILTDLTGNIVFKNTFDARLNILKETAFPLIRRMLWGKQLDEEKGEMSE